MSFKLKPSTDNWERSRPWFRYWRWAKRRVTDSRHKSNAHYVANKIEFRLTPRQVEYLWKRDKGALLDRPSIDRKNPKRHYTVRNCRFIEFVENSGRARRKERKNEGRIEGQQVLDGGQFAATVADQSPQHCG